METSRRQVETPESPSLHSFFQLVAVSRHCVGHGRRRMMLFLRRLPLSMSALCLIIIMAISERVAMRRV